MSDAQSTGAGTTPRHLWIVGAIATLWNSFCAMDYLMTQTQHEAYMSQFTPAPRSPPLTLPQYPCIARP